ncbi:unnamed protein product [Notodromas monacha]|uniref:S1 motif domain-containing protein n=1 Tax=Notodromas monacha TaxID=399045 RepID=A0A7R9BD31_9CRUS|nr:unnamed protein product [Notodromas monacha]CAG0913084.1 unnamed protein product [Notodromas monacha]
MDKPGYRSSVTIFPVEKVAKESVESDGMSSDSISRNVWQQTEFPGGTNCGSEGFCTNRPGCIRFCVKMFNGDDSVECLSATDVRKVKRKSVKCKPGIPRKKVTKRTTKPRTVKRESAILSDEDDEESSIAPKGGPSKKRKKNCPTSAMESNGLDDSVVILPDPPESSLISQQLQLPENVVRNVISLLGENNTIPFMCRYRRDTIGHLDPERLRDIESALNKIKVLKVRKINAIVNLRKKKVISQELSAAVESVTSIAELDALLEPFKASKVSPSNAARKLGLEPSARALLAGENVSFKSLVTEDLSVNQVKDGCKEILADIFAKDPEILTNLRPVARCLVKVKSTKLLLKSAADIRRKYRDLCDFSGFAHSLPSHRILAINRGCHEKMLSSEMNLNEDELFERFSSVVKSRWQPSDNPKIRSLFETAMYTAFPKIISLMKRELVGVMTEKANEGAVKEFGRNLRNLLFSSPLRGCNILGVDPGFTHGCKIAVIDKGGSLLDSDVIYPKFGCGVGASYAALNTLKKLVQKHLCEVTFLCCSIFLVDGIGEFEDNPQILAVGDGCGSLEFQDWVRQAIENQSFGNFALRIIPVSECGASVYSASPLAKAEFPGIDINIISAISIARRLLDPLSEFVKVEPRHLGIGMYQHDVPKAMLGEALDNVIMDCVSEIGADLNTASEAVLTRIAGLGPVRAKAVVDFRNEYGPFTNRTQLLMLKGMGPKTFQQCCGFVRIMPASSKRSESPKIPQKCVNLARIKCKVLEDIEFSQNFNPLDQTSVHPECYSRACKFLALCDVEVADVGYPASVSKIERFMSSNDRKNLASDLRMSFEKFEQMLEALTKTLDFDVRQRKIPSSYGEVRSLEKLKVGDVVVGRVRNVVSFGAFVDIGVGKDVLMHESAMGGAKESIRLGDYVQARVSSVEPANVKRVGLTFLSQVFED